MILRGFLDVERTLFRDWGCDQVASLADARQRYGASATWQGPTFEVADSHSDAEAHEEA